MTRRGRRRGEAEADEVAAEADEPESPSAEALNVDAPDDEPSPRPTSECLRPWRRADRGRDHRRDRRRQVGGARRVSRARRGDGLERRDRPPPARDRRRRPRRDRRAPRRGRARRRTAGPTARASRRRCSATASSSRGSRGSCTRSSRASTSTWREQLAALDEPPRVCVTEVPLLYEVGRGGALRQGRRDHRADGAARAAAPRRPRRPRRPPAARPREGPARRLPLRQHRARSRISTRGWAGVMEELEAEAAALRVRRARARRSLLAARGRRPAWRPGCVSAEPDWYQRVRYPLRYEAIVIGARAELRPAADAARGRDLHGEQVRRRRPARTRARSGSCSCSPRRRKGIAIRTGGDRFVVDDLLDPEINVRYGSWYLRNLLDRYDDVPHGARRLPRGSGQRRRVARARASGSSSPRRARTSPACSTPSASTPTPTRTSSHAL